MSDLYLDEVAVDEQFDAIEEEGALWDALAELRDPPQLGEEPRHLLAGWIKPRELLHLVNRIRTAQGLPPIARLTTGYAVPGAINACMFARALRACATTDELFFRTPALANAVAAELGTPLLGDFSIETPPEIAAVMELFDCGLLHDDELVVPSFAQLSLESSPTEQAQQLAEQAAAQIPTA